MRSSGEEREKEHDNGTDENDAGWVSADYPFGYAYQVVEPSGRIWKTKTNSSNPAIPITPKPIPFIREPTRIAINKMAS